MRIKRTTALILCMLMCLSLAPISVFSEEQVKGQPVVLGEPVEKADPAKGGEKAHEGCFNATGTYLNYEDSGDFPWVDKTTDNFTYIESGNAGQASSNCTLVTTDYYRMSAGEYLEFQYWYSTEQNYDKFIFYVNGIEKLSESGESNGWKKYTYRVTSDGMYSFAWQYHKDGSQNVGEDCVRLAYCLYSGNNEAYLQRAAFAPGGGGLMLSPADTDYVFRVSSSESSSHELYVRSSNKGVANSESVFMAYASVPNSSYSYTIEFDFAVQGENGYDYGAFYVDDSLIFAEFGSESSFSWQHYSRELTPGQHVFKWLYHKDSSNDFGADIFCIDNVKITSYDNRIDRYAGFAEHGLHPNNQAELNFNTPAGSEGFNTVTQGFLFNNNRFIDASMSCFETTVAMAQGETFSFDYLVSTEVYDWFYFKVDGASQVSESGWIDPQVKTCTFTAPSTKSYVFRWEYVKDNSLSKGADLVAVFNIRYNGTYYNEMAGSIDELLNHPDTDSYLNFFFPGTGVGSRFQPYITYSWGGVVSTNKYYEDTESSARAMCFMYAGDSISFEYKISSESDADIFEFKALRMTENGDVEECFVTAYGNHLWDTFTFNCENTGSYYFSWTYYKDHTINSYDDCLILDNVRVTRAYELERALNPEGSPTGDWLWFTSEDDYCFEPVDFEGRYCARSTNHYGSTESVLECGAMLTTVNGGIELTFDYFVSSEENYDHLAFYVNDVEVAKFSGVSNPGWHTFTTPNKYSGWTEFRWVYHKDGNLSYGQDLAAVDNVHLGPASAGMPGDADGSGAVNANDALMILRYSLGIIGAGSLDLANSDVNGDGLVNANDALMVLRASLGIITL